MVIINNSDKFYYDNHYGADNNTHNNVWNTSTNDIIAIIKTQKC